MKSISSIVSFQRKAKETEKQSRWFIVKPREFLPNADNLKEILRCRMDRQVFAIRNDELLICWQRLGLRRLVILQRSLGRGEVDTEVISHITTNLSLIIITTVIEGGAVTLLLAKCLHIEAARVIDRGVLR